MIVLTTAGDHPGQLQVPADEEGQVQARHRAGGRRGEGDPELCRARRGELSLVHCPFTLLCSDWLVGCVQVIALEHPEIEHEMLACVEEVRDPNTNI